MRCAYLLAALGAILLASLSLATAADTCIDKVPASKAGATSWGSTTTCENTDPPPAEIVCPQNFSIAIDWTCTTARAGWCCIPGTQVIAEAHSWTCTPNPCTPHVTLIESSGSIVEKKCHDSENCEEP